MLNRRIFLGALAALLSPLPLQAQEKPGLIVLGPGVSGEILNYWHSYVGKSLEGWLVCNGAEVDRAVYRELFTQLGSRAGPGNETTTFNLPTLPLEDRNGKVVRGTAICPSWEFGSPAGSIMPFKLDPTGN
ncbi:phage tail protein [Bradyrhizobium sp. ORS 111]|uniref:phage tail protein n=1 Tax=Bradyrhizobium sp. ORS 111 TaxID=1685958 RepID=UPI003890B7EE